MMKKLLSALLALAMLGTLCTALAEGTLSVRGVGVVNVDADHATVSMGVRKVAANVQKAQNAVNNSTRSLIAAMRDMGVAESDIVTSAIGIYPNYSYDVDDRITSYTAYNSISVTLRDVDQVGACIDAAFNAGANSLDYVNFFAKDTQDAADRALALAVESAKRKAQLLAEAAGIQLGDIIEIRDEENGGDDANALYAKAEEADAGGGTQVLASKQTVSASVIITFAIDE